jgi:hypothetical protein
MEHRCNRRVGRYGCAFSTCCGAEFFSEQEREKSVFPAAALMRF